MQKCACKKSACDPNQKYCKCVKKKRICTLLCKCIGCKNITQNTQPTTTALPDDESSSSSESSSESTYLRSFPTLDFESDDSQY